MYNTGERSKPEKNYNNKIKTTFEFPPPPTHQTFTQDPISDKYIWMCVCVCGGGVPEPRSPPPDPRMRSCSLLRFVELCLAVSE